MKKNTIHCPGSKRVVGAVYFCVCNKNWNIFNVIEVYQDHIQSSICLSAEDASLSGSTKVI